MTADASDAGEIRRIVEAIRKAWLEGRYEELATFFHPSMVIVPPGFAGRAQGRETCVQSYRDFAAAARIDAYEQSEPEIDVWGDVAVAVSRFRIAYEMGGTPYRESGEDVTVFARENGNWLAAWRTVVAAPPASQPASQ